MERQRRRADRYVIIDLEANVVSIKIGDHEIIEVAGLRIERGFHRPQQAEIAELVAAGLAQRRRQLVEAPTGTGKTFAYLAPAVAYARASGATVEVASHSQGRRTRW